MWLHTQRNAKKEQSRNNKITSEQVEKLQILVDEGDINYYSIYFD